MSRMAHAEDTWLAVALAERLHDRYDDGIVIGPAKLRGKRGGKRDFGETG